MVGRSRGKARGGEGRGRLTAMLSRPAVSCLSLKFSSSKDDLAP